ncbi:hypothetical protein, partial [Mesorhizobium sp. M4B.F.Ca.ET.049.02.1.2]|uniref:hypothetical protein n=1 Tax=Mesorhizobium sp. M4B.F.Ca.ET.049.02.1.2 TaxID=2496752 RepID=UPI001AEC8F41
KCNRNALSSLFHLAAVVFCPLARGVKLAGQYPTMSRALLGPAVHVEMTKPGGRHSSAGNRAMLCFADEGRRRLVA